MGQCQLDILLLSSLSLDSAQYLSPYFSPHSHLLTSPCSPAIVLTAYSCCVTFGKYCLSLGLKPPLLSLRVYNWVLVQLLAFYSPGFVQISSNFGFQRKCQLALGRMQGLGNRNNAHIWHSICVSAYDRCFHKFYIMFNNHTVYTNHRSHFINEGTGVRGAGRVNNMHKIVWLNVPKVILARE